MNGTKNIVDLLNHAEQFCTRELKLPKNEASLYVAKTEGDWITTCKIHNADCNKWGFYVPERQQACVNQQGPFLECNIMHESYGHGIFCQHSKYSTRSSNNIFNGQHAIIDLANQEGFALWLESKIAASLEMAGQFNQKLECLGKSYFNLYDKYIDFETVHGTLPLLWTLGLPKKYASEDLIDISKNAYDTQFAKINQIILYGSQKPFSDIDLFVTGNLDTKNYTNNFLDICQIDTEEFSNRLSLLDFGMTIAYYEGTPVYDPDNIFEKTKQQIEDTPITAQAIAHNKKWANLCLQIGQTSQDPTIRRINQGYATTYALTAHALNNGIKLTNFQSVNQYAAQNNLDTLILEKSG